MLERATGWLGEAGRREGEIKLDRIGIWLSMNASEHGVRGIAISCFRSHSRRGRGFRRRFPLLVPRKTAKDGKGSIGVRGGQRCVRADARSREPIRPNGNSTRRRRRKRRRRKRRRKKRRGGEKERESPITRQNTDNSTVWSRTSADILSHEWPSERTTRSRTRQKGFLPFRASLCSGKRVHDPPSSQSQKR